MKKPLKPQLKEKFEVKLEKKKRELWIASI